MLTPAERQILLTDWSGAEHEVPGLTLPELFQAQVAREPDAIAVVFGEDRKSVV